jgi:predicted transcriptional regulator
MAKEQIIKADDVLEVLTKEPQKLDSIHEKFAVSAQTLRSRLNELVESGKAVKEGRTRSTTYRKAPRK